jgi:two-component system sensor histidine kinase DctS
VRRSEPKREPCSINGVMEDAIALIEPDARKRGVRIVSSLASDLPQVLADRVMIEQVILNLVRNGIDAACECHGENRSLEVLTRLDGDMVTAGVADPGPGIAPEVEGKLFAPFFTTKEHGMGMGLNICRSIVELHDGRLWHQPNPHGGTVFCFSIPAA